MSSSACSFHMHPTMMPTYFSDYPLLPKGMSNFLKKRSRSSSHSGKRRVRTQKGSGDSALFENELIKYFVIPNAHKDWLYVEQVEELSNTYRIDPNWSPELSDTPCFGSDKATKYKISKAHSKKCGDNDHSTTTRRFAWTDMYLMIAKKPDSSDVPHQQAFFDQAKVVCRSSFAYHCGRGNGQGIGAGYFDYAWSHATHVAMLVSDCEGTSDDDCAFYVVGFSLLRNYSGGDMEIMKPYKSNTHGIGLTAPSGNGLPDNVLYIDVICSKFSTAQFLLQVFCSNHQLKNRSNWKNIVFGNSNPDHYVMLRAINPVYTYYPIYYGFVRSIDNQRYFPIFNINIDKLYSTLCSKPFDKLQLAERGLLHPDKDMLISQIFGERCVKHITTAQQKMYVKVYTLDATFKNFHAAVFTIVKSIIKDPEEVQAIHTAWMTAFEPQKIICGDGPVNGYIYGKYVINQ